MDLSIDANRVLVTGATGFIGRAFCERLRAGKVRFLAPVRTLSQDGGPEQVAAGDLAAAEWAPLLEGVRSVVHLAGRAHVMRDTAHDPRTAYHLANAHLTRRLAEASAAAGVKRIVFASTIKVSGEATTREAPFSGSEPGRPQDLYAKTKAEAEAALTEVCIRAGIEAVILRLPLTYGPRVPGNFFALLDGVAQGQMLPFGGIANRRSLLFVGNAVSAIEAALGASALDGTFALADDEVVSTPELIERMGRALGTDARLLRVPSLVLRIAALLAGRRAAVGRLLGSLEIDAARFKQAANWAPPFTLDAGLVATAAWYRERRSL